MPDRSEDDAEQFARSGWAHLRDASMAAARADLQRALELGNRSVDVLVGASIVHMQMGEPGPAGELALEALDVATTSGDELLVLQALGNLGQLRKRQHDFAGALRIARDGAERAARIGARMRQFVFTQDEAAALELLGDTDAALVAAHAAHTMAQQHGGPHEQLRALGSLGTLLLVRGDLDEAAQIIATGLELATDVGDRAEQTGFLTDLGRLLLQRGEPDAAREAFVRVVTLVVETARWESGRTVVALLATRRTTTGEAAVLWFAARAAVVVGLRCGADLRAELERFGAIAAIRAVQLDERPERIRGELTTVSNLLHGAEPAPMRGLEQVVAIVMAWYGGYDMAQFAERIAVLDRELGIEPRLAELAARTP